MGLYSIRGEAGSESAGLRRPQPAKPIAFRQAGAVYFTDLGAYEDAIYRPQGGTYGYAPRPRQTSYYRVGRSASTSSR